MKKKEITLVENSQKHNILPEENSSVISLRLSDSQIGLLDKYVELLNSVSKKKVTRTWVMLKLFELGREGLEKEFNIVRKKLA